MRRFLIAGHLDGRTEMLRRLQTLARERRPDGVLFAGRILPDETMSPPERAKCWNQFFQTAGEFGTFTAVVPGASDVPLQEFLALAKDAELTHPNLHVAHATLFEEKDVAICGLGGE